MMRRGTILALVATLAAGSLPERDARAASSAARAAPGKAQDASPARAPVAPPQASETDSTPHANVSRARVNECGHQWNNMKRAGTATGTWKDFTRGCYAQR